MLFNSMAFAIFLPIVFFLYWKLPAKCQWAVILLSSCYFYMSWNAKYIVLIGMTVLISYICAILIERYRKYGKLFISIALAVCLGTLFFFKYFNFFSGDVVRLLQSFAIPVHPITMKVLLPVGISFYTFQTLSYVIDVYRGELSAERHLGKYAAFITFFPQLVAGPIERAGNLLPQIKRENHFDYGQATYGIKLMAWGFFKKMVIADYLAGYADKIFNSIYNYQGFALLLGIFFFTVQIYCDFSGYSDIARGTANLFGIDLMQNFKSPYFSESIQEFWSRWHISLSTWFRDYVYIPLGGNRVGRLKNYRNLLVTFLVSGLWHGANWTFVIWGGVHGLAQIAEKKLGLQKKRSKNVFDAFLRGIVVFAFVMLAWVFFRVQHLDEAVYFFAHMFDGIGRPVSYLLQGASTLNQLGISRDLFGFGRIAVLLAILAGFDFLSLKRDVIEWSGELPAALRHVIYGLLILIILLFHAMGEVAFVYFQF